MNIKKQFNRVLTDDSRMMWGTHKGERLSDIPNSYWRWLSKQDWLDKWPALADYIDGLDLMEGDDD